MDKLDEAAFINKLYLPVLSPSFMIASIKNINIGMNIVRSFQNVSSKL